MSEALHVIALFVPGVLAADLLAGRPGPALSRWLDAAALGMAIGFGVTTLTDFALRFTANRVAGLGDLAVVWGVILALLVLGRRLRSPRAAPPEGPLARGWAQATWAVLAVYLAFAAYVIVVVMASAPGGAADGAVIWAMLSKTLAVADGELGEVLSRLRLGIHAEYPHFWPGSAAFLLRSTDADALWPARLVAGAGYFALVLGVRRAIAAHAPTAFANVAALLIAAVPQYVRRSGDLFADPWVGALNVLCVGCLFFRRPDGTTDRGHLVAAGFLIGLLGWTKQEGVVLAALLTLAFAATLLSSASRGRRLGDALAVLLPSTAGHAASFLLRRHWVRPDDRAGSFTELMDNLLSPERWSIVLRGLATELNGNGQVLLWNAPEGDNVPIAAWGFFWPALAIVLALALALAYLRRRRRPRPALPILTLFALQFAAYVGLFVVIRFEPEWHVRTALGRLLSHLAPIAVVAAFVALGRGEGSEAGSEVGSGEPGEPIEAIE